MDEFFKAGNDFVNHLADSLWASLPEKTADDLARCKKDVLNGVRSFVNAAIDEELKCTDERLENARRMREEAAQQAASDNPTAEAV
jgi:hypothetical protein